MHDAPAHDVQSRSQMWIAIEGCETFVSEFHDEGQCRIVERLRRRHGNGTGHVRDAVMDDAIEFECRMGMCRGLRRFEASALIDRHVNEHSASFHFLQHGARHQLRRAGSGNEDGADDDIGRKHLALDRVHRCGKRRDTALEKLIELAKAR